MAPKTELSADHLFSINAGTPDMVNLTTLDEESMVSNLRERCAGRRHPSSRDWAASVHPMWQVQRRAAVHAVRPDLRERQPVPLASDLRG